MLLRTLALAFAAYFVVSVADGEKPQISEISARCREENHLEMEEVTNINKTKYLETNDERVKCYVKCVLNGLKLMNEEGDLTLEDNPDRDGKFKKHFPACKDVTGTDPCDKAVNFQNCMKKQIDAEKKTSE